MENGTRYFIIFFVLMALQIFILNNVSAIGMTAPYLYVAFVLMLPINLSPTFVLLLSFFVGLIEDLSISSLGVHSCAMVFLAFVRPTILKLMAPRGGYERNNIPLLKYFGFVWALKYVFVSVLIHHLVLYFCFSFSLDDAGFLFVRMLINVFLTVLLILLSQLFVFKK